MDRHRQSYQTRLAQFWGLVAICVVGVTCTPSPMDPGDTSGEVTSHATSNDEADTVPSPHGNPPISSDLQTELPTGIQIHIARDDRTRHVLPFALDKLSLSSRSWGDVPLPASVCQDIGGALAEIGPSGSLHGFLGVELRIPHRLTKQHGTLAFMHYDPELDLWFPLPVSTMTDRVDDDFFIAVAHVKHFSLFGIFWINSPVKSTAVSVPDDSSGVIHFCFSGDFADVKDLLISVQKPDSSVILVPWKIGGIGCETEVKISPNAIGGSDGVYTVMFLDYNTVLWEQRVRVGGPLKPTPELTALATKYAPVLRFHPSEKFLPRLLETPFFAKTEVTIPLQPDITVSGPELPAFLATHGHAEALLDDAWFTGGPWATDIAEEPVGVHWFAQEVGNLLYLDYWMFYRHDPKSDISSQVGGHHDRDAESITLVLKKTETGHVPEAVLYFAHLPNHTVTYQGTQAKWSNYAAVSWQDVDKSLNCNRPVVHVAEGSHACYPRSGSWSVTVAPLVSDTEGAGGGATWCQSESADSTCSGEYVLVPLGVRDQLSVGNEWDFLAFSGYWIDGTWDNGRWPPFAERLDTISKWNEQPIFPPNAFGPPTTVPCEPVLCVGAGACPSGQVCANGKCLSCQAIEYSQQCADGIDNDCDGCTDSEDKECGSCSGTCGMSPCGQDCGVCESCFDGKQNQGETGADCGGPCAPCGSCNDGICQPASGETCTSCPKDCCLASPVLKSPTSWKTYFLGENIQFSWAVVPNASSYRIRICTDVASKSCPIIQDLAPGTLQYAKSDLAVGIYYWSVAALPDVPNVGAGPYSSAWPIRIGKPGWPPSYSCPDVKGDVDASSSLNVTDVQCAILAVLSTLDGGPVPPCVSSNDLTKADINCSAAVDITDAILTIQLVLGLGFSPALDTDGDLCLDSCVRQGPIRGRTATFVPVGVTEFGPIRGRITSWHPEGDVVYGPIRGKVTTLQPTGETLFGPIRGRPTTLVPESPAVHGPIKGPVITFSP